MQENKHISTGLAIAACALSLAAFGDANWPESQTDAYWEDVWGNVNDYYVFLNVPDATVRFRSFTTLPSDRPVWFDGSHVTFIGDDSGCGIQAGKNWNLSLTVGRDRGAGYLTIKDGRYTFTDVAYVGVGSGTKDAVGELRLEGGTVSVTACNIAAGTAGSKGAILMSGGRFNFSNNVVIGRRGDGSFEVSGGDVAVSGEMNIGGEYMADGSDKGTGTLVIKGGTVTVNSYSSIGRTNKGEVRLEGGEFLCKNDVDFGRWAGADGTLDISDGKFVSEKRIFFGRDPGTGTINLNGGVVECTQLVVGTGSGNLNLNGGTLRARGNQGTFIQSSGSLPVKIGPGGAMFDTAGYAVTVPATLGNADGLEGNGQIGKKGAGTLTLSSSLDLDRTFKFVINGGVGPIALTGSANTLGEGKKISVAIDPVQAEINTQYTLLTGLNTTWTLNDNFDTLPTTDADGFYTYDWDLSGGTLSVTLGYTDKAAVTARNNNGSWDYYDANDTLIADAPVVTASTVYYGTGTIGADCDWSDLKITIPESGTLDLNGYNLKLGSYNAGSGAVITNSKADEEETSNLSTLSLGVNGGVMNGNASVKFTGNLKVALVNVTDATAFSTSITHEHTGGWLFATNNTAIRFSTDCAGPGPLVLAGKGGFTSGSTDQGYVEKALYVYGDGNSLNTNSSLSWHGFFRYATWHGDGELVFNINAGGNADNGNGIPEIGGVDNSRGVESDFSDFSGTLKIQTNNSLSLGLFMYSLIDNAKTMSNGRLVLGSKGVVYQRDGANWFSLGDLSTAGDTYDADKVMSVFTKWRSTSSVANWEVGALGLNSTFAGRIANSGTTNIRKVGAGTWTLNAECENQGMFTVDGGTMRFMRNASNSSLGFSVNNGGILAPGDGTSGTLTVGSLSFAGTPVLSYELGADSVGSLLVSGSATVSLDNVSIVFSNSDIAQALDDATADRFTLVTAEAFSGTPSVSATLPTGWELSDEELPTGRHALVLKSSLAASYYVWTGAAQDGDSANAENWAVYASDDTYIGSAVPSDAALTIVINSTLDADLSSLTAMQGARVVIRGGSAKLAVDVDLSGYNVVFEDGASLDLAGHTLTLADYAGGSETAGAVTSSVSGGRLNAGVHTGLMEFTGAGNTYAYNSNHVWTGNGSNGDWNTASNWSPAVVPLETGTVTFVGNADIVSGTANVSAMSIASGASVSFGSSVTFSCVNVVNDGTLTFGCTVAAPGPDITGSGSLVVAEGGSVTLGSTHHLRQPLYIENGGEFAVTYSRGGSATLTQPVTGQGTFAILDRVYVATTTTFNNFAGVIDLRSGSQLNVTLDKQSTRLGTASIKMQGGSIYLGNEAGVYCSNPFEIHGTGNLIWSGQANMFMTGSFTGTGEVVVRTDGGRGPRPSGDNSQFAGVFTLRNVSTQGDTGFHGANATSAAGKWIIDTDNNNRVVDFADAQNGTFHVGELYQSVASTSLRVTTTGTGIVVGERSGGESVINGRFTGNAFSFTKLGADSWLTLGQGFAAVAGSTFDFSAGGICFNLPACEAEPTSLIGHTVTFDPSVKIRVAMTQAQYEALDLNDEYLVAKLPTNPGYKPETELLVDGTVLDTPAAARWCVRFKSFPAVGETPAYVGAVLCRRSAGLIIIVY